MEAHIFILNNPVIKLGYRASKESAAIPCASNVFRYKLLPLLVSFSPRKVIFLKHFHLPPQFASVPVVPKVWNAAHQGF